MYLWFTVYEKEAGSVISSGYLIIKPKAELDIEYLQTVLHCNFVLYYLRQVASTGIGMSNWSYADLADMTIILPSLAEQRKTLLVIKQKIKELEQKIEILKREKEQNSLQSAIDRVFNDVLGVKISNDSAANVLYANFDFSKMTERLSFKNQIAAVKLNNHVPNATKLKKFISQNPEAVIRRRTNIKGKLIEFKDIDSFSGNVINYMQVDQKFGSEVTKFKNNDIMYSKMNPQMGNMVLVTKEHDDYYGSAEFWGLNIDQTICVPEYVLYALGTSNVLNNYKFWLTGAQGSSEEEKGGRARLSSKEFLNMKIPVPAIEVQKIIIEKVRKAKQEIENSTYDVQIKYIENTIDTDLNRYILNGYSEDLFNLSKHGN